MATMLPHIRSANKIKRIDEITKLYYQICVDNLIRIDINKISQPIESITLAWMLAICCMGYQLFKDVDFNNPALDSMAYALIDRINDMVANSKKHGGSPKYYDEYDFSTLTILNRTISYKIPPDIITSLLTEEPFNQCTIQKIADPTSSANESHSDIINEDTLKKPLIDVIKEINPNYIGSIHNKTSAPHKLIIRVIAVMIKQNMPKNKITWKTVHLFIEKHIYQHHTLESRADLEDVNEDELKVDGITIYKRNCQNKISRYKNEIFNF